jgi:hypothetical protein
MVALGLVAAAAVLLWWMGSDDSESADPAERAQIAAAHAVEASGETPSRSSLQPEPEAVEPPMPAGASSFADASEEIEPPQPHVQRIAPPGTLQGHAKALRKLPHASTDRAPVGGIGPLGMHVDRIGMGTRYRDGVCTGPTGKFSVEDDDFAHLCFRVVHPRVKQRVIVRWERNGTLVRRTVVPIADSHAYRTRATLPLRHRFRGEWTVRIVSLDGIELAAHSFSVE